MSKRIAYTSFLVSLIAPLAASAHEVYVLTPEQVARATAAPAFDMWSVMMTNSGQFIMWGFVAALTIFVVFGISVIRPLERSLEPYFAKMRPFASTVARVTVGVGFLAGSLFQATYGPELPLSTYGGDAPLVSLVLAMIGTLLIIGFWARGAAVVALLIFALGWYLHGSYMLTYTNYLGEIIVLLLIGSHRGSVHSLMRWKERFHPSYHAITDHLRQLAFPILRVCFGVSLLYASLYAKVIHNNLALQVASMQLAGHAHPLAYYFGFQPYFMVLGAAIVEIVIGMFFVLGLEIRFTSLFLLFWLSLSLWFFGETVWPHIILIGIPIAFIMHGYDKYSLEGRIFKKRGREPVF